MTTTNIGVGEQKVKPPANESVGGAAIPPNPPAVTKLIPLDDIVIPPDRMRALQPAKIDEFAKSMGARGFLLQPIGVRPHGAAGYQLVFGWHRLTARRLGWTTVEAKVLNGINADQAELAEIEENLIKVELSAAARALHVGKYKELYEKLHPETKVGATGKGRSKVCQVGEANDRFTQEVAKKAGQSERTIAREAARAKRLSVLKEVVGTSLDKGTELDALAKCPEDTQQDLAARAKAGEKVSAIGAPAKIADEQPRDADGAGGTITTPPNPIPDAPDITEHVEPAETSVGPYSIEALTALPATERERLFGNLIKISADAEIRAVLPAATKAGLVQSAVDLAVNQERQSAHVLEEFAEAICAAWATNEPTDRKAAHVERLVRKFKRSGDNYPTPSRIQRELN